MELKYRDTQEDAYMALVNVSCSNTTLSNYANDLFKILWVRNGELKITVDAETLHLAENEIAFLTPHQQIEQTSRPTDVVLFAFNKAFYCIQDHDEEVSCHGLLFYGSAGLPRIQLPETERQSLEKLYAVFLEEFAEQDHIQGEMLRMLLKRLLIKSTRLIKTKLPQPNLQPSQLDIIRQFNVLVEMHFREKHFVADYAELLFKSPKTLSNLFKAYHDHSPLEVINARIILEAKRLLLQTDLQEKKFPIGWDTSQLIISVNFLRNIWAWVLKSLELRI